MPKYFTPYLTYIENFEEACELYEKLIKENKEFKNVLKVSIFKRFYLKI